ncbi:eukaryotic translation initiation factor 2A [Striga asiatica]|uniref:Eukaryotic translation initiation factor 2A n=1 Tax=Striga asiatica TaxID=4170 RepID=A0A5A7P949_STRAF|nr:eukaryotic translation initiation factor 2A [Striga asiatica]
MVRDNQTNRDDMARGRGRLRGFQRWAWQTRLWWGAPPAEDGISSWSDINPFGGRPARQDADEFGDGRYRKQWRPDMDFEDVEGCAVHRWVEGCGDYQGDMGFGRPTVSVGTTFGGAGSWFRGSRALFTEEVDDSDADGLYDGPPILDEEACGRWRNIFAGTWAPPSKEFAVVYGFMLALATIFDKKSNPLQELGTGPCNTIGGNSRGRFTCLAGFGMLPSDMAFWD